MSAHLRYLVAVVLYLFSVTCTAVAASSAHHLSAVNINESRANPVALVVPHDELELVADTLSLNDDKPSLSQIAGDIPSEEMLTKTWQGQATIEVYLVSDILNTVGNVTGSALYGTIYEKLDQQCPPRIGNNDHPSCYLSSTHFPIRYRKDGGNTEESMNQIKVMSSKFATNEVRRPLIGAIAGAYEAMTNYDRNCFRANDEAAGNRHCNVATRIKAFTEDSWISMSLSSDILDDNDGSWHCCETRELIDAKLDAGPVGEFKNLYPTQRGKDRLVECNMGCASDQRSYNIDIDKALIDVIEIQKW